MDFTHLEFYMRTGKYHPETPDFKKRGIRKASHNFVIKGNDLFYVGKGRVQKVCREHCEKLEAVRQCHESGELEECTAKNLLKVLQRDYYWHGLTKDIERKLYVCEVCMPEEQTFDSVSMVATDTRKRKISGEELVESLTDEKPCTSKRERKAEKESTEVELNPSNTTAAVNHGPNNSLLHEGWPHASLFMPDYSDENNVEKLLERIAELESLNSWLMCENRTLKMKLRTLHTTLENQKSLPQLKNLIEELKKCLPLSRALSAMPNTNVR